MDRGAGWAVVHGVEKNWTRLSDAAAAAAAAYPKIVRVSPLTPAVSIPPQKTALTHLQSLRITTSPNLWQPHCVPMNLPILDTSYKRNYTVKKK